MDGERDGRMPDNADAVPLVRPGDVLAGKYRVERVLGQGGMGVVVAARHLELDEMVALKILLPTAMRDRDAVSRFVREARAAAKIKSEYVARVTDVARLDTGVPYMVMEYLDGQDLAALSANGPLPVPQAASFVLQACEALAEAHRLGIIHRDLKPANLFCVRRPNGQLCIKVLDFGISKLTVGDPTGVDGEMTRSNALLGTPFYMSPEQMRSSRRVDARSDIWSLGVILYKLLTGRQPFTAESFADLAIRIATESPEPLRSLRPEIPPGLERIVAKCLQKDADQRFCDVKALASELLEFAGPGTTGSLERIRAALASGPLPADSATGLADTTPLSPEPAPMAEGGLAAVRTATSWGERSAAFRLSPRSMAALMALMTALAVVGVVSMALRRRSEGPPAAAMGTPEPSAPSAGSTAAPSFPVTPTPPSSTMIELAQPAARPSTSPALQASPGTVASTQGRTLPRAANPGSRPSALPSALASALASALPSASAPPQVPDCRTVSKPGPDGVDHLVQECQ
jgi:eukaryotic-like serine/threonine-protein kinase